MPLNVALVGIGKIAQDQHVPAIANSTDWSLVATVSRSGRVDEVPGFETIDALLAAGLDIDVVSLCTPPTVRFDITRKALEAGCHVMLEKPPAATIAEILTLETLAKTAGKTLFTTWHSREAHHVDQAKAWLKSRRVRSCKITWRESVWKWHPGQDWVFEAGGMGVFDPGINALSIMTKILPDPVHVTAASLEVPENKHTPIAADIDFAHPEGATVSAHFDWRETSRDIWDIEIATDDGLLVLTDGGANMTIDGVLQPGGDAALHGEYPRLYARMHQLVQDGQSDVDLSPMIHVSDAMTLAERKLVAPFSF